MHNHQLNDQESVVSEFELEKKGKNLFKFIIVALLFFFLGFFMNHFQNIVPSINNIDLEDSNKLVLENKPHKNLDFSCPDTLYLSFLELDGWRSEKKIYDDWELQSYEYYELTKQNHKITIGMRTTGTDICMFNSNPKIIKKESLGDTLIGTLVRCNIEDFGKSQKCKIYENMIEIEICSEFDNDENIYSSNYQSITNIGLIYYEIPLDYNKKILEEMDQIIASIQVL